jgi:general secretion pathway protein J
MKDTAKNIITTIPIVPNHQGRGSDISPLPRRERARARVRGGSFLYNLLYTSAQGFTLLELTISITLIGLIVLIIVGAMSLGYRSIEAGEKKAIALERIRASFSMIDAQVQSHVPLTYEKDGEIKYYFQGERELMRFSSNYSIWGGAKGYVITTYSVRQGENGKQILYASENIAGLEGQRETVLLDNFEKIYFEYFFQDPTEEEGSWKEQWSEDVLIPAKVRLHFINGATDLSLIIPVRVQGSPEDLAEAGLHEDEGE